MTVPLVFSRLTIYDGGLKVDTRSWNHFSELELAKLDFLSTDPVDRTVSVRRGRVCFHLAGRFSKG